MSESQTPSALESLVRRCANGDRAAWEDFDSRFRDALVRNLEHWSASRALGEDLRSLAEDVAQDVLIELWTFRSRLAAFPTDWRELLAFLIAIGRQPILQRLRSYRRHVHPAALRQAPEIADQRLIPGEVDQVVAEFARLLPPREKEFLENYLLKAPDERDDAQFSAANRWRLLFRLLRRWPAFRRGD